MKIEMKSATEPKRNSIPEMEIEMKNICSSGLAMMLSIMEVQSVKKRYKSAFHLFDRMFLLSEFF